MAHANDDRDNARDADLIVVGGGLAGLIAAALVARAGRSAIVLERSGATGGRAVTQVDDGVHFNLGPHALYRRGHAVRVLSSLDVPIRGGIPRPGRALVLAGGSLARLPIGPASLALSRLLTWREKWLYARLPRTLARADARGADRLSVRDWVRHTAGSGRCAAVLEMLFRLATYVDEPELLSAGAAIDQLASAFAGNVLYLDGGWQSLVDGLRALTQRAGVALRTHARVDSVRSSDRGVTVALADGATLRGRAAILAVAPDLAARLLQLQGQAPLARFAAGAVPVRAATLDVALDRLPRPEVRFALGLERPLYYSVHSAAARLGPPGVAVLHVLAYLGHRSRAPAGEKAPAELEDFLERVQPGWRARVIARRFLPEMVVAHAVPPASEGGLAGRPAAALRDHPNVFLAGDWVGARGMLADAAAASAEEAARFVLALLAPQDQTPGKVSHVGS